MNQRELNTKTEALLEDFIDDVRSPKVSIDASRYILVRKLANPDFVFEEAARKFVFGFANNDLPLIHPTDDPHFRRSVSTRATSLFLYLCQHLILERKALANLTKREMYKLSFSPNEQASRMAICILIANKDSLNPKYSRYAEKRFKRFLSSRNFEFKGNQCHFMSKHGSKVFSVSEEWLCEMLPAFIHNSNVDDKELGRGPRLNLRKGKRIARKMWESLYQMFQEDSSTLSKSNSPSPRLAALFGDVMTHDECLLHIKKYGNRRNISTLFNSVPVEVFPHEGFLNHCLVESDTLSHDELNGLSLDYVKYVLQNPMTGKETALQKDLQDRIDRTIETLIASQARQEDLSLLAPYVFQMTKMASSFVIPQITSQQHLSDLAQEVWWFVGTNITHAELKKVKALNDAGETREDCVTEVKRIFNLISSKGDTKDSFKDHLALMFYPTMSEIVSTINVKKSDLAKTEKSVYVNAYELTDEAVSFTMSQWADATAGWDWLANIK